MVSDSTEGTAMPRYLVSFDDFSMDHIPESEMPEVGEAAHTVLREAKDAGVWITGGGLIRQVASVVGTDGSVMDGPDPAVKVALGGFSIIEVASRDDALAWAARFAAACRCAQEVREIMADPEA